MRGIPTTTPARTILDLRRSVDRPTLERAIAQAEVLRLPIGDPCGRSHEPTRSELERRFLRLCSRHGLPKPEVNVRLARYEVDFLWREWRIVVETDGWAAHGTRSAFQADRARDAKLMAQGYEVLRFTYRQVVEEAEVVAAVLGRVLALRRLAAGGDGSRMPS